MKSQKTGRKKALVKRDALGGGQTRYSLGGTLIPTAYRDALMQMLKLPDEAKGHHRPASESKSYMLLGKAFHAYYLTQKEASVPTKQVTKENLQEVSRAARKLANLLASLDVNRAGFAGGSNF